MLIQCCIIFILSLLCVCNGNVISTVYYNSTSNTYTLAPGADTEKGVSWGWYDAESMNSTGWATLSIVTSSAFSDEIQYTAAGYLEGFTTQEEIYALHEMFNSLYSNTSSLNLEITAWFENHISWLQTMVTKYKTPSSSSSSSSSLSLFWNWASLVLAQVSGLTMGYNHIAPPGQGLSFTQLFMLNSGGDLMDVMMSISPSVRTELFLDHCSALILPIYDESETLKDMFTGHTTWNQYNSMLRIYKHYLFNHTTSIEDTHPYFLPTPSPGSYHQAFSSYPSFLFSGDDYYVTSSGLAVIETTFTIFNNDLYQFVKPDNGVLTWMRATIANRLATNGSEWADIFSTSNSGTYNNQWMIVDYKRIGNVLVDDTLWVIEQIPGSIKSGDMTQTLRTQGYWPSYNIPYFETIYNLSGYADMAQQSGAQYVYNTSARANIFRRDSPKIATVEDMKTIMQYNDWQNDPLSLGNPSYSISSRFDLLNGTDAQVTGGIDSKVTTVDMFKKGFTWAISGPTHQQQSIFSWKDWESAPHNGQPLQFDFDWVLL